MVGYCPGPALASYAFGGAPAAVFLASMLAGMGAFALADTLIDRHAKSA
jgi:hypothetical protein